MAVASRERRAASTRGSRIREDRIDQDAGKDLAEQGCVSHSPTFKLGRALLNEVFYLHLDEALGGIQAPTLFVYGTADTLVPVESSRWGVVQMRAPAELIELEGAQHSLAYMMIRGTLTRKVYAGRQQWSHGWRVGQTAPWALVDVPNYGRIPCTRHRR
jgi:hypothetical protein